MAGYIEHGPTVFVFWKITDGARGDGPFGFLNRLAFNGGRQKLPDGLYATKDAGWLIGPHSHQFFINQQFVAFVAQFRIIAQGEENSLCRGLRCCLNCKVGAGCRIQFFT